jgi:hypothetical protein
MMPDRAKYEQIIAIAASTSKQLIEHGVDGDFASSIRVQIERKAGSLLPPVNGTMSAALSDAVTKVI